MTTLTSDHEYSPMLSSCIIVVVGSTPSMSSSTLEDDMQSSSLRSGAEANNGAETSQNKSRKACMSSTRLAIGVLINIRCH